MVRIASAVVLLLSVYVSLATTLAAAEPTDPRPLPTEGEAKILAALAEKTAADFQTSPLSEVVEALKKKHQIEIQLDAKALEETGTSTDTPVTIQLTEISLRSLLRLLLGELDLTYVVRDGYLLITSKTEAENMLRVKVYPVRDLVTLDSEFRPPLAKDRQGDEDYQSLIILITSTVAPTTWDEVGGPGAQQQYRSSHSITFAQTEEVHEEAAELLAALRRARDVQIAAAKAIAHDKKPQPEDNDRRQTKVYRLLPSPVALWYGFGGVMGPMGGMGMGGMGGGGMGGGMYRVTNSEASGEPAQNSSPSAAPAPVPAAPAKTPDANSQNYAQALAMMWDQKLFDEWSNELARTVPRLVEPESWGPGGGSIEVMAGAIVVRHKQEVQEKIAEFLAEILPGCVFTSASPTTAAARLPAPGARLDWPKAVETSTAANHARIEETLEKKCDIEFSEQPLRKVIDALAAQGPLQVWIDNRALADSGVALDVPITHSIHGVSLRTAFKLVLGELDLTYVVRDEVFRITSKTEAELMLVTKVYPVFDLITNVPIESWPIARRGFHVVGMPSTHLRESTDFNSLIQNITAGIASTTWDEVGGPGAIQSFTNSAALVISQTNEVHEEIAAYLKALREAAVAQQ